MSAAAPPSLQGDMGAERARFIEPLHGAAFYRFAVPRPVGPDRNRRDKRRGKHRNDIDARSVTG